MSFSRIIPANRIEPLAWLGKTNWITPTNNGYRWTKGELQAILNRSLQYGRSFAHEVREIINLAVFEFTPSGPRPARRTMYSDIYFMPSKVLATGQKTIQLSQEWCEAFENTELTLHFKDYRQPYPTMVIELPANYAEAKFVPGVDDYPECVAIHHEEQERVLLIEIVFHNSQMSTLIDYSIDEEIESALKKLRVVQVDNPGFDANGTEGYLAPFLRIGLNAIVAMTYGTDWRKLEPTKNEQTQRKVLRKRSHASDKAAAMKARLQLGTMPDVYQFDQNIKAFEDNRIVPHDKPEKEGSPKKVHWRRGHWRQQAVGLGRSHRELRWIRPMLINSIQFKGDLKDTTTTYTT